MKRLLTHLFSGPWLVGRYFSPDDLERITQAITQSEHRHSAELRFCVEGALDPREIWRGVSPRERAIETFSELRIWDTPRSNGVLLYLLLADHDIEIVADRAINERVGGAEWGAICGEIEASFRENRCVEGVLRGIERISNLLAAHFPSNGPRENDLPNEPVVKP